MKRKEHGRAAESIYLLRGDSALDHTNTRPTSICTSEIRGRQPIAAADVRIVHRSRDSNNTVLDKPPEPRHLGASTLHRISNIPLRSRASIAGTLIPDANSDDYDVFYLFLHYSVKRDSTMVSKETYYGVKREYIKQLVVREHTAL